MRAAVEPHDAQVHVTRLDRWVWAVRLYKTRSVATAACRGGHVKVNGAAAKPATQVRVGDRVAAQVDGRERVIEVLRVIESRVGPAVAGGCIVDHSPPPPTRELAPPNLVRDPAAGRPTKRERRQLDRLRRR
jgi:ribosome-associated heat shock protein Hsp15